MRRADRELKDLQSIEGILRACDTAIVAMTDDEGWPYCVPVNYGFAFTDGALTLYFHGAKDGKKAELLKRNPRVSACMYRCLELQKADTACGFSAAYESVMAFGYACMLESEEELMMGLRAIMEKAGGAGLPYDQGVLSKTAVFAIRVERFTAKRRG